MRSLLKYTITALLIVSALASCGDKDNEKKSSRKKDAASQAEESENVEERSEETFRIRYFGTAVSKNGIIDGETVLEAESTEEICADDTEKFLEAYCTPGSEAEYKYPEVYGKFVIELEYEKDSKVKNVWLCDNPENGTKLSSDFNVVVSDGDDMNAYSVESISYRDFYYYMYNKMI